VDVNDIYSEKDIFAERERVFEDEYFRKRDRELIERLRDRTKMDTQGAKAAQGGATAVPTEGAPVRVELSAPERDLLVELVQRAIRELRVEVRHTSTASYRATLRARERLAESVIDKLRTATE